MPRRYGMWLVMGNVVRHRFGACGQDVRIYEWVRILGAENISIGSHVIVDDFVFIDGRGGVEMGDHIHIASYVSLGGGGRIVIGDFVGLAAGTRIVSGTDLFDGSGLTGPTIPPKWRSVHRGEVHIGRHAVLGTNVVVHPDVHIGDGAIVGSCSLVTTDLPAWTISFGVPARPVRARPREAVERYERELRKDEAGE